MRIKPREKARAFSSRNKRGRGSLRRLVNKSHVSSLALPIEREQSYDLVPSANLTRTSGFLAIQLEETMFSQASHPKPDRQVSTAFQCERQYSGGGGHCTI